MKTFSIFWRNLISNPSPAEKGTYTGKDLGSEILSNSIFHSKKNRVYDTLAPFSVGKGRGDEVFRNIFFFLISLFFFGCQNTPSKPPKDIEYNIDNVRILIPREYQKVSSEDEIREKFFTGKNVDDLSLLNKILYDALVRLNKNQPHWFVKFENDQLEFIALKTDGPPLRPKEEMTSRLLEMYEDLLNEEYQDTDSTYRFVLMEDNVRGAHQVQYFKNKYFHHKNGVEWYTTNYLIYSNARTIGISTYSPNKDYDDLENHMQFIQIK